MKSLLAEKIQAALAYRQSLGNPQKAMHLISATWMPSVQRIIPEKPV